MAEDMREALKGLREIQPDLCWRPSPDWERVCILDLGHGGNCGWQYTNGDRMHWTRHIDGAVCDA